VEADWEFEIAADAPVIDAAWPGFIDLRSEPARAFQLPEANQLACLPDVLLRLNASASPVWTAKCDVWEPAEFDPDELDAPKEAALAALACYIDLLPANEQTWPTLDSIGDWCRCLCGALRPIPLRQCRADLVIRPAFLTPNQTTLGVTAYVIGCGLTASDSRAVLAKALRVFSDALRVVETPAVSRQKLQWKHTGE
jgi:hypothetical protein